MTRTWRILIFLPLVDDQFDDKLRPFMLRMLQADLHRPAPGVTAVGTRVRHARVVAVPAQSVVQTLDVPAGDDLAQTAVLRVAHLDEVAVEEQDVRPVDGGGLGPADELHDDAARDLAVLVDVDGALLVREQEFALAESEHAERLELVDPGGDGADGRGLGVGDGKGELLVEREDFDAAGGGDGERGVEEVECVSVGGNVEVVEVAEELGCAAAG